MSYPDQITFDASEWIRNNYLNKSKADCGNCEEGGCGCQQNCGCSDECSDECSCECHQK